MSRRRRADKREVIPDPKFGDVVLTKFMNSIMNEGKKSAAERIVYGALDQHGEEGQVESDRAVPRGACATSCRRSRCRSRRVGGATYQVPVEVRPDRRQALAIRWLIAAARGARREHHGRAPVGRAARRRQQPRDGGEEARRHAPDGGGQPGVLALPLVTRVQRTLDDADRATPLAGLPQYRDHGAHRRRQDHDHRAHPLLHRQEPQDRRGARRRRHHGLDGAGAGARHHHHLGRDHRLLERQAHQHHRHARPRRLHHRGRAVACACSTAR